MVHNFNENITRGEDKIVFNNQLEMRISAQIVPDTQNEILNIRMWSLWPGYTDWLPSQKGIWISVEMFYSQLFPKIIKVLESLDPNVKQRLIKIITGDKYILQNIPNSNEIDMNFDSDLST